MAESIHNTISLNFHVDFPKKSHSSEGPHFQEQDNEKNKACKGIVVVLLGWNGATHKYLEKYSEFYLQKGCIALRCITPMRVIAHDQCMFPLVARGVISALQKYKLNSHPLFFHVFSNGGAYLYSSLLREIAADKNQFHLDVRGTIFDSGPYPRTMVTVYRAAASVFDYPALIKPVIAGILTMYYVGIMLWQYLSLGWKVCLEGEAVKRTGTYDEIKKPFPLYGWLTRITSVKSHNFMFLYSKSDYVTPWEQVERIAAELESRGNSVALKQFEGSNHVAHYRMHPEEYKAAAGKFICHCMESYKEKSSVWLDEVL